MMKWHDVKMMNFRANKLNTSGWRAWLLNIARPSKRLLIQVEVISAKCMFENDWIQKIDLVFYVTRMDDEYVWLQIEKIWFYSGYNDEKVWIHKLKWQ